MIYYKSEDLTIRSMIESDIKKLTAGFVEQNWSKPCEQFEKYYNQQTSKEKYIIIAETDESLAGYTTLVSNADEGAFAGKNIPEIVDFNVFIKYQRKGIGNKILDVAEMLAGKTSDYVCLGVGLHSGYGTAQRMYIKRGYIFDGTGVWYKNRQLEQNAICVNDDDLILYLSKQLSLIA